MPTNETLDRIRKLLELRNDAIQAALLETDVFGKPNIKAAMKVYLDALNHDAPELLERLARGIEHCEGVVRGGEYPPSYTAACVTLREILTGEK